MTGCGSSGRSRPTPLTSTASSPRHRRAGGSTRAPPVRGIPCRTCATGWTRSSTAPSRCARSCARSRTGAARERAGAPRGASGHGACAATADGADAEQSGREVEVRESIAAVLTDLGRCFAVYGRMVCDDGADHDEHRAQLRDAFDAVRRSRARLADLLLVDPREAAALWQLHGSLLAGVDRVLAELDLDAFAEGRERRRREAAEAARLTTQVAPRGR